MTRAGVLSKNHPEKYTTSTWPKTALVMHTDEEKEII